MFFFPFFEAVQSEAVTSDESLQHSSLTSRPERLLLMFFFLFPSASEPAPVLRQRGQDGEVLVSGHWGANPNLQGSQAQR